MRTLMLLRHAKSDWDSGVADDFDRPLAGRGRRAAKRMAEWMKVNQVVPDYVISSTAARARETTVILGQSAALDGARIEFDEGLYLADVGELLTVLRGCPRNAKRVMVVGHNPGLEDLLTYVCGDDIPRAGNGKLLPTAALARVSVAEEWKSLKRHCGVIIAVTRPKEL